MTQIQPEPLDAVILALPETAGSALYGMLDVLSATGNLWQELVGEGQKTRYIEPRIVSRAQRPFLCGNGIPVNPALSIRQATAPGIIILPEMWLAPSDDIAERYTDVKEWIRDCYENGSSIYTACSGSVLLASTGLLDGRDATSHWGYQDLFRKSFPEVHFNPGPNLMIADQAGRIVTAGGTTSWHDLALHIITRHCSPGEALRIAKLFLLKWHGEGQLPFQSLVRRQPHADAAVRRAEEWLSVHFREPEVLSGATTAASIPERTLKRRFKTATGSTLIGQVQNLRIEEAKRLLESGKAPADTISVEVGYDNPSFFRRLFKRCTGLTPGAYRRMFQPMISEETAAHKPD